MPTIRFDLSPEYECVLMEDAGAMNLNIQDYIRYKLFGIRTVFNVDEVLRRIKNGDFSEKNYPDGFTIPDLFSDDEWESVGKGPAGVLGRQFYKYIIDNPECGIYFCGMGKNGRRAHYKYERRR